MKRLIILGIFSYFLSLNLVVTAATAAEKDADHHHLSGNIRIGGGLLSGHPSGLEVMDRNEIRADLNDQGQRQSDELILLSTDFGYIINDSGTTLGAGIRTEGPVYLSLSHEFAGAGKFSLSALYEKKEVWQNPYLVGISRSRTDQESLGFAVSLEQMLGTRLRLKFEQMNVDIKDDVIGQLDRALGREGTDTTLEIGYDWSLGAGGVLSSNLSHIWYEREGAANEGCAYVAELKHMVEAGRLTFISGLEFRQTQFEEIHPLFNKERQEFGYGISEMISLAEPLGYENWSIFIMAAYGVTDANISFFESSVYFAGSGIGYNF